MQPELHLDPQQQFVTNQGATLVELSQQCRERYLQVAGLNVSPWEEADDGDLERWLYAVNIIAGIVLQVNEDNPTNWKKLAARFASEYYINDNWEKVHLLYKTACEVVVRHITNMAYATNEDVGQALQFDWVLWTVENR